MIMFENSLVVGVTIAAALTAFGTEWWMQPDLARRHIWVATMLGILTGSLRLLLRWIDPAVPFCAVTLGPQWPGGWQLLGDVISYGAFALLGLVLGARAGLRGVLLAEGGGFGDWWRVTRYGFGLGIPLAAVHWLGMGARQLSAANLSQPNIVLAAAQAALGNEIVFSLGLLPLLIWLLGLLPRTREAIWPLAVSVLASTVVRVVACPMDAPFLTILLGLASGYAFVRAGWEAAFLVYFGWAAISLIAA